jgi:hypothetical protein
MKHNIILEMMDGNDWKKVVAPNVTRGQTCNQNAGSAKNTNLAVGAQQKRTNKKRSVWRWGRKVGRPITKRSKVLSATVVQNKNGLSKIDNRERTQIRANFSCQSRAITENVQRG